MLYEVITLSQLTKDPNGQFTSSNPWPTDKVNIHNTNSSNYLNTIKNESYNFV